MCANAKKTVKSSGSKGRGGTKTGVAKQSTPISWETVEINQSGNVADVLWSDGRVNASHILWDHMYKCAFCYGKGERPQGTVCAVCRGSRQNAVVPPVVVCAFCHGRGKVSRSSNVTCTSCKGTGVIGVKEPIAVCPDCRGRGRARGANLTCMKCKGSGVIEVRD